MRRRSLGWDRPTGPVNPFELYLIAACVIQGAGVLSGVGTPRSIIAAVNPGMRYVWAASLVVGGVMVLIGLFWPNQLTGIEIKRPGLIACGGATLAFGVAVVPFGPQAFAVAVYNIVFAMACFERWRQVTQRIRDVRRGLVEARMQTRG